ncbi:chemotaxis protein CheW [Halomontanus rarus]|uniref:chemotaxis protein CheW n=1 Tax=Halomontanus rarus TaxID=3034020 RepID=UPI0023E81732|nr:chemotaxis protein CheW [Halovivax sp. TS33]
MTAVPDPDLERESETDAGSIADSEAGADTDTRQSSPDDGVRILPFESQGTAYCVETHRVSRALGVTLDGSRSLERATDPWYAGEVSFESRWKRAKTDPDESEIRQVRVVDLARVFSSPTATLERPSESKLLVFETTDEADRHYGWLVDDVDVTTVVRTEQLEPTRTDRQFVTGRVDHDGTTLIWLDDRALNG